MEKLIVERVCVAAFNGNILICK